MKFGMRKPSFLKSFKSRTTEKLKIGDDFMKRKRLSMFIIIILFFYAYITAYATPGWLKMDSIITYNGKVYGQHSSDNHWHLASKQSTGRYTAIGDPIPDPRSNSVNGNVSSSSNSTASNSTSSSTSSGTSSRTPSSSSSGTSKNSTSTEIQNNKSNDTALLSLKINNDEIAISDNIKYITKNEKVDISAIPRDSKSTVYINKPDTLIIGENQVKIDVTAEDGTKKEYAVTITRERQISDNANLLEATINGVKVTFKDSNDAKVNVSNKTTELDIKYTLEDSHAKAEIIGNTTIEVGDNKVIIKVTAENGNQKDYILTIHRYSEDEERTGLIVGLVVIFIILGGLSYLIYYIVKIIKRKLKKV